MHSQLRGHPFAQLQSVIRMPTTLILSWRHSYTQKHCPPHHTQTVSLACTLTYTHTALQANTCPLRVCPGLSRPVCVGQAPPHPGILSVLPRTEPAADSLVCSEWEIGLLWPKIIGHQALTLELLFQKPIPAGACLLCPLCQIDQRQLSPGSICPHHTIR